MYLQTECGGGSACMRETGQGSGVNTAGQLGSSEAASTHHRCTFADNDTASGFIPQRNPALSKRRQPVRADAHLEQLLLVDTTVYSAGASCSWGGATFVETRKRHRRSHWWRCLHMIIRLDVLLGNPFLESPEDVPADDKRCAQASKERSVRAEQQADIFASREHREQRT